jgi:hypothetical protein
MNYFSTLVAGVLMVLSHEIGQADQGHLPIIAIGTTSDVGCEDNCEEDH